MKHCLVLAFEDFNDLPDNWRDFDVIDAYGASKLSNIDIDKFVGSSRVKLNVQNQFFEVKNFKKPNESYKLCFIRHPDPWGEPRNWLQAIAALGACLDGGLVCEFWFPHEVIAFNFLLTSLLGDENVKLANVKQEAKVGDWKNYSAKWNVGLVGKQDEMLSTYKNRRQEILQKLYIEIGKNYRDEINIKDIDRLT